MEVSWALRWIEHRPRTPPADRRYALWKHEGRSLTLTVARQRLHTQLEMIRSGRKYWRTHCHVLSTNIRFTASGARDRNVSRGDPVDPGVALYFELDGKPVALACDRWATVQDNIAAIAAHIDALRGQERWGVADIVQAFAGHMALPPPGGGAIVTPVAEPWHVVLGVSAGATPGDVRRRFRELAATMHPDAGGNRAQWDRLQRAIDAARLALGMN